MSFSVLVSAQDADLVDALGLPVATAIVAESQQLIAKQDNQSNSSRDASLVLIGGIACSQSGLDCVQTYLSDCGTGNALGVPPICNLTDVGEGQRKEHAYSFVANALSRALTDHLVSAKNLLRSLAEIRQTHAQTQSAFSRLERFVLQHNLATRTESLALMPGCGMPSLELKTGETLSQRLPCSSAGLSDVCLFIDSISGVSELQSLDDPLLVATLVTAEDNVLRGRWLIPKGLIERGAGSVRLSLRTALDAAELTPMLDLRLLSEGALKFSTSLYHPDPRFPARVNGRSEFSVLALRTWSYFPGCEAPIVVGSCLSSTSKATPSFVRILDRDVLAKAYDVTPDNPHSCFLEDSSAILVHPEPEGISVMKIPAAIPAKTTEVKASISTTSEKAPGIEYAFGLNPSVIEMVANDQTSNSRYRHVTPWVKLGPLETGELYLPLGTALSDCHDLFLMTRLSHQPGDNAWGWSTFSKIRVGISDI